MILAQKMLRQLPSVDALVSTVNDTFGDSGIQSSIVVQMAREVVDQVRAEILTGEQIDDPKNEAVERLQSEIERLLAPRLAEVINATGVIIHTNLGRAPVSADAAEAMRLAASRYTPLELEIGSGKRGGRMSEISRMLRLLTGAESSLVVNNNAAAVLLVLSALCSGKEVILSRSQAVEIGGGFRIPDVLRQSGAELVEVGTTNRTYVRDYEQAINERTGALLTVHWSNFRIIGFTDQPTLKDLSTLARSHSLPLVEDLGSGTLLDTAQWGLTPEPTVQESIRSGVDVVCFSGDKLLGGPQAGIISGSKDLVEQVSRHPLARAVRADKTALAGIAATLRHYIDATALSTVPVWRMISSPVEELRSRAGSWLEQIGEDSGVQIESMTSAIGGGSLPGESLPSWGLAIDGSQSGGAENLARRLRNGNHPVMPHIEDNRVLIDARTVLPDQDQKLVEAILAALNSR